MGIFQIPDPVSMVNSYKDGSLERQTAEAFASVILSNYITGLWAQGSSTLFGWFGEGQAARDMATVAYLSLTSKKELPWLVLTVPKDLLSADNLSRFQSQFQSK